MLIQPWEIQLLSALVLRRGEECITHFPTEKAGLLLAHLAAYPLAVHTREDLVERFWPDSDPANGRVSLRQALASLRRMLEPPDVPEGAVLLADRAQVRLNPEAVHTDLALWDRMRALASQASTPSERLHWLEEAIRSYGGDFLPGAYMEWVLTERQHRQEQYQETLLSLIDTQVECGDTEGAIAAAQLLLRTDPLQEEAHERLMRLFASQGKLGLARRQYQKLCRLLRDELNLAPDPKVQALYADLERISRRHAGGGVSAPALDAVQPSSLSAVSLPALPMAPTPEQEALPRLPLRLTRFFGREDELRLLCAWLEDPEVRLMTLTGIGGVGKTRLALQAAQQRTRFGAAITFIPLSDTQDPNLLLPVILQTLGMPAVASSDPLARLGAVLGSEPHLLILDNFEQIAEQAAETVWRLLEQIPSIACLVTSRQALNLPGEYELALAPLPVPDTRLLPQELIANPTVQMLVDRMRARRPDFQVTPANAVAVATLCAHLEGIPLAVELAAGWARDLTISQMQERLAHRFDLLVSRQHGVPPRHQSLRAAVESSYQLLTPSLQRFFLRLSVFRGGWREEMAEVAWETEAGGSEAARAEGLRTLREHSLITVQEVGERVRYGMLETLRAFGQEMLAAEETRQVEARHAARFLEFARETAEKLHGQEQAHWLDRLEEEQDNLRGALEYGMEHAPLLGLRLANALYWFWYVRSHYREGELWLTTLLERAAEAPKADIAWGLLAAGHFANCQSNNPLAASRYEAARVLFVEIGDARGIAHALCRLGNAAQEMLDCETGYRLCAESIALFRTLKDPSGLLFALFYYFNIVLEMKVSEQTRTCFDEALELAEALGDLRYQSLLQHCFSQFQRVSGNIVGALEGYRKALRLQRLLREPLALSYILREISYLASAQGDYRLAARIYGAMQGLRRRIGYPTGLHEQIYLQELEAVIHSGLNETDYRQEYEAGQALDFEPCLTLAEEATENR